MTTYQTCPKCNKPLMNLLWHGITPTHQNAYILDNGELEWGESDSFYDCEFTSYWTHEDCGHVLSDELMESLNLTKPDAAARALMPPTDEDPQPPQHDWSAHNVVAVEWGTFQ